MYGSSPKSSQHNFVLAVIYYIILEHTRRLTSRMYYTPHFSTQSLSTSTAMDQRESRPFLSQFDFCSRSHFFTFSLNSSSIPNLFPRMTFLRTPKRWKTEGARSDLYSVWGKTVHPSDVFASSTFKRVWLCVVLKEDYSGSNRDVRE